MGAPRPASHANRRVRVLDAGALIALDRGDRDTWALLAEGHRAGQRPVVPAPVIAQAWRGAARQARLATVLASADVVVSDAPLSRRAGELLAVAGTADVLDALVALVARDHPGCEVLTSDPADIHHLLQALNVRRRIRVV
ncbi:MAG: PIN domain-containing protein [Chloroflexota bacterium]